MEFWHRQRDVRDRCRTLSTPAGKRAISLDKAAYVYVISLGGGLGVALVFLVAEISVHCYHSRKAGRTVATVPDADTAHDTDTAPDDTEGRRKRVSSVTPDWRRSPKTARKPSTWTVVMNVRRDTRQRSLVQSYRDTSFA